MATRHEVDFVVRAQSFAHEWFARLVVGTIVAGYLLIVVGGIVRVSGSGLGCGNHWPDCNGAIVPSFSTATAIEYAHRVVAAAVVLLSMALVAITVTAFRTDRRYIRLSVIALGLVLVQAILGAVTVEFDLPPSVVMAHLGTAELFLATLIVLGVLILGSRRSPSILPIDNVGSRRIRRLAATSAGSVFVLMLVGAYTATSGAGYACTEWPLCNGHYLPTGWNVIDIQLLHRTLALVATIFVTLLIVDTLRHRHDAGVAGTLVMAVGILLPIQILLGAANIWFKLAPAVSAAHLATATMIWGLLVTITALEYSGSWATSGSGQSPHSDLRLHGSPGSAG